MTQKIKISLPSKETTSTSLNSDQENSQIKSQEQKSKIVLKNTQISNLPPNKPPEKRTVDFDNIVVTPVRDPVKYLDTLLAHCVKNKISDIHIEPYEKCLRIRVREDGELSEYGIIDSEISLQLIARVKVLAQLDISEKRKQQDGRIKINIEKKDIDFRVSILPVLYGEKVVLRLLDSSNLQMNFNHLGFDEKQTEIIYKAISRPYGLCLVTGPTGSGKSTTLYSMLVKLNSRDANLCTVEDPVEFNLPGINQVNVRMDAGLTFAGALKTILRQDPDVIMIGEIRDKAVAEIAIEAALTGHIVLSTMHTNDVVSTITRLINLDIDAILIASALNVIIAQRLCRKICSSCKEVDTSITPENFVEYGFSKEEAEKIIPYKGAGCAHCNFTGYKGRIGIYEVAEVSAEFKRLVINKMPEQALLEQIAAEGMATLKMDAFEKVARGLITVQEALSNTRS